MKEQGDVKTTSPALERYKYLSLEKNCFGWSEQYD